MNGLVELIFERVPDVAVATMLSELLRRSGIQEMTHSELGKLDAETSFRDVIALLRHQAEPSSIFIRAGIATVGAVRTRCPLVRLLRYEETNELTLAFERTDIEAVDRKDTIRMLSDGAKLLASSAGTAEYYCGFEPATDERTRLFSKSKIGPLVSV
ncbi:hypothetical protein [Hydrogenophaga sp.]|uniref:hypothetical protein n=1 Tax=Hydrogenophaga sp. TaxID=1904254 RepID=UPI00271AE676|nr:hypothetical protein [Hydrogenophaga sp.]MDO9437079.1 hypothetical protein [Hydrogenophaga sp.]